jgi:hypothetical protein
MVVGSNNWLAMEHVMEEKHVLLQMEDPTPEKTQPPQLLIIFSHVVNGTFSKTTFSLILFIRAKED